MRKKELFGSKRKSGRLFGLVVSLAREFDSWISEKVPAGRIKPAFFVSNF